ncbi:MAG: hypothetical protein WCA27_07385 [Candidatus Sulfotelmatobacter sp.]
MTQYISATEKIYRELSQPASRPQLKPARVATDAKPITLTRADVDAIIQRSRGASPEELEYAITHAKDLILTDGERDQLGCDLSIAVARRAQQVDGRREDPSARLIYELGYAMTPHGLLAERVWFERELQNGTKAIAACRRHSPPQCSCWREVRENLYNVRASHGEKSPESFAAWRIWEALEEMELAERAGK